MTHQEVRRGDVLVLCSDGLSGQVKKEEIAQAVTETKGDLAAACDKLIALANERGGPDNITVVMARFDGDGLRSSGEQEEVGHQVYPLIDTETSTEPVPIYKGSKPPVPNKETQDARFRVFTIVLAAIAVVAAVVWYFTRSP